MHQEYVRLVPNAETAVLFLHGIVSSPRFFDERISLVSHVPENFSVYNLLLPGHGGTVEDFSKSSMQQWKNYVWEIFEKLASTHQRVILVGHSMGTLFALQLAMERPEKIPFLFLLCSPIHIFVSPAAVRHCMQLTMSKPEKISPKGKAMGDSGSVKLTRKLWKYIPWVKQMLQLLAESRRVRKMLPQLQIPAYVFRSQGDEMVGKRSAKVLRRLDCVRLQILDKSTHFFFDEQDEALVQQRFASLCRFE